MRDVLNKVDEMKKAKTEVIDISSQPNFSRVSPILYAVHKQKKKPTRAAPTNHASLDVRCRLGE